ncbi:MAG TPA: hypothetical protein VKG21_18145 [Casimicrobiaceae bacterium]|nr:hypothetical protein [Casimicrobiaceae bacterium]
MRVFVAGSLRDVADADSCRQFVAALGRAVVQEGHILLNGCRNVVDKEIAEAAHQWLVENDRDPKRYLISYWQRDVARAHNCGTLRASALPDWKMSHSELRVPEQIENADVMIFVGGAEGTYLARNWAHWARRTIVGVPRFGGAGEQIYVQELRHLRVIDPAKSERYEQLNEVGSEPEHYAKAVIELSVQLLVPKNVFPVMSFKKKWRDVYRTFDEVCKGHGFLADRIDETVSLDRINPRIEAGIAKSAFVVADLSEASPNVFFEVGYAKGCGKPVILTAEKGTELPFDLADVPVLFWKNQEELRGGLNRLVESLKKTLNVRLGT